MHTPPHNSICHISAASKLAMCALQPFIDEPVHPSPHSSCLYALALILMALSVADTAAALLCSSVLLTRTFQTWCASPSGQLTARCRPPQSPGCTLCTSSPTLNPSTRQPHYGSVSVTPCMQDTYSACMSDKRVHTACSMQLTSVDSYVMWAAASVPHACALWLHRHHSACPHNVVQQLQVTCTNGQRLILAQPSKVTGNPA
jgi:hypothetical protein